MNEILGMGAVSGVFNWFFRNSWPVWLRANSFADLSCATSCWARVWDRNVADGFGPISTFIRCPCRVAKKQYGKSMNASAARAIKLLILFLTLCNLAVAQMPAGSLAGAVRDQSGAAVAAAHVKLHNAAKGLIREVNTSPEGDYSFAALPAGEYEVSVDATGFRTTPLPSP